MVETVTINATITREGAEATAAELPSLLAGASPRVAAALGGILRSLLAQLASAERRDRARERVRQESELGTVRERRTIERKPEP